MRSDTIRKRCIGCRRVLAGDRSRMQWCPDCGGEMRPVKYGPARRRVGNGR